MQNETIRESRASPRVFESVNRTSNNIRTPANTVKSSGISNNTNNTQSKYTFYDPYQRLDWQIPNFFSDYRTRRRKKCWEKMIDEENEFNNWKIIRPSIQGEFFFVFKVLERVKKRWEFTHLEECRRASWSSTIFFLLIFIYFIIFCITYIGSDNKNLVPPHFRNIL